MHPLPLEHVIEPHFEGFIVLCLSLDVVGVSRSADCSAVVDPCYRERGGRRVIYNTIEANRLHVQSCLPLRDNCVSPTLKLSKRGDGRLPAVY